MDAYLAIVSRREGRRYAERPVPENVTRRILDAGRVAGSAVNRQPWTFHVVESPDIRERLAETVFAPDNVRGASLVIAISVSGRGPVGFDAGRAAQNMLLAAWNEGLDSTPNGMPDRQRTAEVLGLAADEEPVIVLTFVYPVRPRDPEARSADEWIRAANRKPLEDVVRRH